MVAAPNEMMTENSRGIVRSKLDVVSWLRRDPSPSEVRPTHCPACQAPSRPIGLSLGLHGHGRRERQLRGPSTNGQGPATVIFRVRRYRCRTCGAIITVAPREAQSRRLFSGPAIGLALALYGLLGLSSAAIRGLVSPWRTSGPETMSQWRTLSRWVRAIQERKLLPAVRQTPEGWPARKVAERAAAFLASYAPVAQSPPPFHIAAFVGAAHIR
jgi:hypothetical protein